VYRNIFVRLEVFTAVTMRCESRASLIQLFINIIVIIIIMHLHGATSQKTAFFRTDLLSDRSAQRSSMLHFSITQIPQKELMLVFLLSGSETQLCSCLAAQGMESNSNYCQFCLLFYISVNHNYRWFVVTISKKKLVSLLGKLYVGKAIFG
jgi:hypothetical protein